MKTYQIKQNNNVIQTSIPEIEAMQAFLDILNRGEYVKHWHDINNPSPVECGGFRYQITEEDSSKVFSEKLKEKQNIIKSPEGIDIDKVIKELFAHSNENMIKFQELMGFYRKDKELKIRCLEIALQTENGKFKLIETAKQIFDFVSSDQSNKEKPERELSDPHI